MSRYDTFRFDSYEFDEAAQTAVFRYSYDDSLRFTETYHFDFAVAPRYSREALDRALFAAFILAGTSYYKAYIPSRLELRAGSLNKDQAAFFSETYTHGLGEFMAVNQLDPFTVDFPYTDGDASPVTITDTSGSLVPLSGGKDSLVSFELLAAMGEPITTWTVGHAELLAPLRERTGAPHATTHRTLDSRLASLPDAHNGHIPITAILTFIGVASAILRNDRYVVFSNERSAEEGTMKYRGIVANHQYSKTFAFEQAAQRYISDYITPSVEFFSLVRPLSELRIGELLVTRWFDKYADVFTSCNRNWTQLNRAEKMHWCGECPKCAFAFTIFAPFLPKERLVTLFGGKNLFTNTALRPTFEELLGLRDQKPFECVGEIGEVRAALQMALDTNAYPELAEWTIPATDYDYRALGPHAIPSAVWDRLQSHLVDAPAQ